MWADNIACALNELQRHDMPVLLDLSRGTAALQHARELKTQRASTLMFAVVDTRRPELTTEAVLAGVADVFARPLGGRRVATAIERETGAGDDAGDQDNRAAAPAGARRRPAIEGAALYCHSTAMHDVSALISRAATMKAGVVILGEAGTGRQMVARSIHAAGSSSASRRPTCLARPTCPRVPLHRRRLHCHRWTKPNSSAPWRGRRPLPVPAWSA